jgi:D-alanyl-D-alanine carboxypeptidase
MQREEQDITRKKRVQWLSAAAAVLVLALLVIAGLRVRSWNAQRQEARALVLVNPWNSAENAGFKPRLSDCEGWRVDRSCRKSLQQMLADCRAAGIETVVTAAWRSREEQQRIFDEEKQRWLSLGYSEETSATLAAREVGRPGESEHELGLAVDIAGDGAQAWLRENAWRYGFILRYPEGSESVTGRKCDPSHFRYVGSAAAAQMASLGQTLEEYLEMFFSESAEIIFE